MNKNIYEIFIIVVVGWILGAFCTIKAIREDFPQIKDSKINCLELNLGKETCDKIFKVINNDK